MSEAQEAPDAQDKPQIGLTPAAIAQLDAVMETGWFADRQDAYRVAIAVALSRRLEPSAAEMIGIRTAYNFTGGIDRDGKLRQLIAVLNPAEAARPAAFSERLAQAGLSFLHERLVTASGTLSDALDPNYTVAWT